VEITSYKLTSGPDHSGLPVIRPESGGKGYDFPQNWSSLLQVKGTRRIQSSASIPLCRAGILRRERFQHHGGAHAAARNLSRRLSLMNRYCDLRGVLDHTPIRRSSHADHIARLLPGAAAAATGDVEQ